jgi:hypothetical protein
MALRVLPDSAPHVNTIRAAREEESFVLSEGNPESHGFCPTYLSGVDRKPRGFDKWNIECKIGKHFELLSFHCQEKFSHFFLKYYDGTIACWGVSWRGKRLIEAVAFFLPIPRYQRMRSARQFPSS